MSPCHTPDACEPDSCWVCWDGTEPTDPDTGHETGCRCDGCDEDRAFDARRDERFETQGENE